MHHISFESCEFEAVEPESSEVESGSDATIATAACLDGERFSGEVTLIDGEVWRLRVWQRIEDAEPRSQVLGKLEDTPFTVAPAASGWVLGGDVVPEPLLLEPAPFLFHFAGLSSGGMEALRYDTALEVRRGRIESSREPTPSAHAHDGLALGAGLRLLIEERPGRRYFGLGERTGFLDKRGRVWTNWTSDEPDHHPLKDPLYQAHPFVLVWQDGRCFGLYLDETWRTVFDLAATDERETIIQTDGPTFDLLLIPGPTPREVLERFTELVGRAPMPPLWAFGVHQCRWGYPDARQVQGLAEEFRHHELPLEALWLDLDYMDGFKVFTTHRGRFPDFPGMVESLEEQGVRTVVILDPCVKVEADYGVYETGTALRAWVQDERDQPLRGEVWPKPVVWPDFSRADVRDWWGRQHRGLVEAGVAGIWNDMNEPAAFSIEGVEGRCRTLPLTARQGDREHADLHNVYGLQMAMATRAGLRRLRPERRPFILTRSGFTGIQRYAFVWTGDNMSCWEHLEGSIPMMLNLQLSGVPFVGADVGGFGGDADAELVARWTWLGAVTPFLRNHSGRGTRRQEPWRFPNPWRRSIAAALRFRMRILPLLYTLAHEACETGIPPWRALVLEAPDELETVAVHDAFLLGSDLLVAPVTRPDASCRAVPLPSGDWRDFWTGERLVGGQTVLRPTPVDRLPLLQRAGSALPLTAVAPHTTTARWPVLEWRVALGPEIHGVVFEDDGDGHEPGRLRELHGSFDGRTLRLELDIAEGPERQVVTLPGESTPSSSSASWSLEDGLLRFVVAGPTLVATWGEPAADQASETAGG